MIASSVSFLTSGLIANDVSFVPPCMSESNAMIFMNVIVKVIFIFK